MRPLWCSGARLESYGLLGFVEFELDRPESLPPACKLTDREYEVLAADPVCAAHARVGLADKSYLRAEAAVWQREREAAYAEYREDELVRPVPLPH
jgi:hypothetical protein